LSRRLVRLDTDVPLELDWEGWTLKPIDVEPLMAMCREWGFASLTGQIRAVSRTAAAASGPTQRELFAAPSSPEEELFPFGATEAVDGEEGGEALAGEPAASAPAKKEWKATYPLVDTYPAFDALVKRLQGQKRFAIDLETTSLEPVDADLVGVAVSF